MPNSGRRVGQQWDQCARCGRDYPIGRLTLQKGLLVCYRCHDNLQVERRHLEIQQALAVDSMEGADLRMLDRSCFTESDEL